MKTKTLSLLMSAASACCGLGVFLSCSPKEACATSVEMVTDSLVADIDMGHFAIAIQHPADTTSALAQALAEYASEVLGGVYQGEYTSPHAVMAFYHSQTIKDWQPDYQQLKEVSDADPKFYWNAAISKVADTPRFLTVAYTCESYQGGAHGLSLHFGITLRKSDCRRMGWEILRNSNGEKVQELMRQGLKEYFNVKTDDELKNLLFNENYIYTMPLPQCPPLFTADGIQFVYNPYEIAPYAAGRPTFVIPYEKLSDNLTVTAQRLCGITTTTH